MLPLQFSLARKRMLFATASGGTGFLSPVVA
jgi:hypothetical protein